MDKRLDLAQYTVTGIVSVNSIEFVERVFYAFDQGKVVAFLKHENEHEKIQATGAVSIVRPQLKFGWCHIEFGPKQTDDIAQISFTSGTTGKPKGVLLPHRALNDVVERLNNIMEVDSSIREYVGVPTNYSFGFGRCRAIATIGGEFYLPEYGFNPLEIRDLLIDGSINAISAVPSLWRTLFQYSDIFGAETKKVKWIEIGSQYMSRAEKELLLNLFPNANIVQHYGLTEASRTSFLRIDQTNGEYLESVGKAYGQTAIKISDNGHITIKGPHVAEQLLIEGKITSNVDSEGWFETSDRGSIKDGYLYYLGRTDDLINCGGVKVSPDSIERYIREKLGIQSGIAVAKAPDPIRGELILVCLLESANLAIDAVRTAAGKAAIDAGVNSPEAIQLLNVSEFPTTDTGKVQRKKLTQTFVSRLEAIAPPPPPPLTPQSQSSTQLLSPYELEIATVWIDILDIETIDINSNFFELGGDSLTAISVMVKMEKMGINPQIIKGMLQGLSIRELAQRLEHTATIQETTYPIAHQISNEYVQTGMAINIVRGLLVLCVILGHWHEGFLNALPVVISGIKPYLAPLLGAGTPGFAIIYGVSVGYSMLNIFRTDYQRFKHIQSSTCLLLALGVVTLALFKFGEHWIAGEVSSFTDFTNSFYSVITYYFLITLTLPLWLRLISSSKNTVAKAFFWSLALYCTYYFFIAGFSFYKTEGILELIKLLATAKYSYFNLTAGVLNGVGIGILIRNHVEQKKNPENFLWIGTILMMAGIVICSHAEMSQSWWVWPSRVTFLWAWLFYLGMILAILHSVNQLLVNYNQANPITRYSLQFLSTLGLLAFPAFILHDLVIPLKSLLVDLHLPGTIALEISIVLFLTIMTALFKKVYRVNFTW